MCMHIFSLLLSLIHSILSQPDNSKRILPVQPRPIPAPHLGYLFVARGSEVAGLLSVLSAAGVPWVASLLTSTKSLHSQEEN